MKRTTILTCGLMTFGTLVTWGEDGKTSVAYGTNRAAQSPQEVEDIGEIQDQQGATTSLRDKLRFSVGLRGEYTSNAQLSGNHTSSDFVSLPTLNAGYRTALGKNFTFDGSVTVESAIFSDYYKRSFIGYSGNFTLDYRYKPNLPRVYLSAQPYRYDAFDSGDLMTEAIGLAAGTDWGFGFNQGRSLAFVGYTFTGYIADPHIDTRLENRAVIGLAHQIRSNLTGQIYYVYQYSDYTDVERHDSRNIVSANLIYQFTQNLFGNISTSFVDNDSSQSRATYQGLSATFGLNWQF